MWDHVLTKAPFQTSFWQTYHFYWDDVITMSCLQSSAAFLKAYLCKYALEWHLWPLCLPVFQRVALETFFIHQGYGSGYYFTSRVYESNNFGLASNVSLVESESVPLILLVGELENSNMISTSFFKCRTIFSLFFYSRTPHAGDPARCWRTLSPVFKKCMMLSS